MNSKVANFVYIAVALITIALVRWSAPAHEYRPHGIVLPADLQHSKRLPDLAAGYKPLATIHVQYHYQTASEQNFERVRNYTRDLAKNIGAKGLVERQPLEDPAGKMLILSAIAIQ